MVPILAMLWYENDREQSKDVWQVPNNSFLGTRSIYHWAF
jgi:hypothetical protein